MDHLCSTNMKFESSTLDPRVATSETTRPAAQSYLHISAVILTVILLLNVTYLPLALLASEYANPAA